ncbi:two-component response regulator receiver [Pandoraea communis]|uniref:Two-component response regulator receiver n=1 Tax=Pandoraea communis TaxID=2508297 RepID=A0A5E4XPK3_9BURK|nr:response regulator [Pandoraea communis]VVE38163.1 two-component response regulator receiver [Pandoraea communis]
MIARPTIAIVDDDAAVRNAMGGLLRSLDLGVQLFGGGQELLRCVSLPCLACVITDAQMPGMDGFALIEALRARHLDMPVIFMTAFAPEGFDQRAKALGATCVLHKPFQDTDIIQCIERALCLRKTGASPS